jgi:flavin-dependent dehydrogenase
MLLRTGDAVKKPKVVIIGAGPAGSSLAIRLAQAGIDVALIERERFPRQKLCGEFISPECLRHFDELGVLGDLLVSGGSTIHETRFYDRRGRSIAVPSRWFRSGGNALSISRARMDDCLLRAAERVGVEVHEGASAVRVVMQEQSVAEIVVRDDGGEHLINGDIFIDATGRSSAITKLIEKALEKPKSAAAKPPFVAFKAHLNVEDLERDVCEIYSFDGGYGGLSPIENGLANLCFIVRSDVARSFRSDADRVMSDVVCRNPRASFSLQNAEMKSEWVAVAIRGFGRNVLRPAENVFTAGDAASFIDPFTGSGILMALESSEILAASLMEFGQQVDPLETAYRSLYRQRFDSRLRISSILRSAAFHPGLATAAIVLLGTSDKAREFLAKRTRGRFISEN